MSNSSSVLSRDWILKVAERPPGYAVIYNFCDAVRNGQIPKSNELKFIADACQAILDSPELEVGLWKFSKQLNLIAKQGRPEPRESEVCHRIIAAWDYRKLRQTTHKRLRLSERAAASQVARKYRVSESTIRRWSNDYQQEATDLAALLASAEARAKRRF